MKDINPHPLAGIAPNPSGRSWPDENSYNTRKQVMELRRQGLSFPKIAARIGRTQGWVYKVYQKSLKAIISEDVIAVRKMELARLDELQMEVNSILEKVTPLVNQGRIVYDYLQDDFGNLVKNDNGEPIRVALQDIGPKLQAMAVALKIMERRAKLLGLDAPTKVAATNPTGDQEATLVQFYLPDNGRDSNTKDY
jgi:hypothetical protein